MRGRLCVILALLALALGAARAEPLCFEAGDWALLTDEAGEALLGGEGVEAVFAVRPGALYAAGRRGAYRLYDARGSLLSDMEFAMIDDMGDCLVFRRGDRYGAMDEAGRLLLDAEWTQLVSDGTGGWLALQTDPLDETADVILRVSAGGEATPTGVSTSVGLSALRADRMPFMASDGRYGAINGRGEIAVEPVWRALGPFDENGLAKAADDAGLGMIDADGVAVIATLYDWLERGEGFVAAGDAGGIDVYTPDGMRLLFSVEGERLEGAVAGGCLAVRGGEGTRLFDRSGNAVYESGGAVTFAAGVDGQLIASDGPWGEACCWVMNPDGSAASERFQRVLPLCAGRYAYMTMDGIEYYSPDLDRVQTSWNYESVRYGLMDGSGNVMTLAVYTEIRAVADNRLLLTDAAGTYLADVDGGVLKTWPNETDMG